MSSNYQQVFLRFTEETIPKKVVQKHQRVHIAAAQLLIDQTPVKTGRARANWNNAIDEPDTSVDMDARDPDGYEGKVQAAEFAAQIKEPSKTYITNSLDYVVKGLENGTSQQAPVGIVKVVAPAVLQIAERQ